MNPGITLSVRLVLERMTDDEVLAQRMAVIFGGSHSGKYGYEKIKTLLTQENGTKMHTDTRSIFLAMSAERLGRLQ